MTPYFMQWVVVDILMALLQNWRGDSDKILKLVETPITWYNHDRHNVRECDPLTYKVSL